MKPTSEKELNQDDIQGQLNSQIFFIFLLKIATVAILILIVLWTEYEKAQKLISTKAISFANTQYFQTEKRNQRSLAITRWRTAINIP